MYSSPTLLQFSDNAYRKLLRAYPQQHRRQFGPEMAQVFRDLCREIYQQEGLAGFVWLWMATLFDLFKTSLEERLKEATNMTNEKFVQLSGWALICLGRWFWE